jgi:hypothetical protein
VYKLVFLTKKIFVVLKCSVLLSCFDVPLGDMVKDTECSRVLPNGVEFYRLLCVRNTETMHTRIIGVQRIIQTVDFVMLSMTQTVYQGNHNRTVYLRWLLRVIIDARHCSSDHRAPLFPLSTRATVRMIIARHYSSLVQRER